MKLMYLEAIICVARKLTKFLYLDSELLAVCRVDDNSVLHDVLLRLI